MPGEARECPLAVDRADKARGQTEAEEQHRDRLHVGVGAALVYMTVTGLANTAPILPGNAGLYQGAAVGALAMVGHAGATAVAASLVMPVMASVITASAAIVGISLYGRRFAELPRAALAGR